MLANKNTSTWTTLLWLSGGNLNTNKCFYYYIEPHYDHNKMKVAYKTKHQAPGTITMHNPATSSSTTLQCLETNEARRTLGVIMAPNRSSTDQTNILCERASTYINKIKRSKLTNKAKWTAITTVLEPGITYPLLATLTSKKEMERIDKLLSHAKCQALGLNEHFPRAVLYGPHELGGIGIKSATSKTTTDRITYFLYHSRRNTTIGKKLEVSMAYLQLEVGTMLPILQESYQAYGALATHTLVKQIWAETEPIGLQLRAAHSQTWHPIPQGHHDCTIMELASRTYSNKHLNLINRYRLYLQVITIYNLIQYDRRAIHPEIMRGDRVLSRESKFFWVDFPRPPKSYKKVWKEFITELAQPYIKNQMLKWTTSARPTYHVIYMYSSYNGPIHLQTRTILHARKDY